MDMNLPDLIEQFGSEEKCRDYLEELRWPNGVECPRCQSKKIARLKTRTQFECECGYQFSVTVGTVMQDSHLPLWKWFLAVYLMVESKKGVSSNQLKRMLKVSYKTAWYLSHRIRSAMDTEEEELLRGIVEADETWIGGERHHFANRRESALHRFDNKAMILGAVERGGNVRLRVERKGDHWTIHRFLGDVVDDSAEAIYTDSNRAYHGIADENTRHEFVNHAAEEWVRGDVHTQTIESVWSLFKRSVIGSYHHISVKHLGAYVDEMEWRYNNRDNSFLFRDTIVALVKGDTLTFKDLTAKA